MGRKKITDEQKKISREKRLQYLKNYQKEHWHEYYQNNKEKILEQQKRKKEEIKGSPLRDYNRVNLKGMNEQEKKEYYNQKMRESRARKKNNMTRTEYGEIINSEKTYEDIADILKTHGSVLIGWTDEIFTHYDILFVNKTVIFGTNIQRGIKATDLFISIMGIGAFGFKIDSKKTSEYIAEKLNLSDDETAEKLAELINGVIERLGE